MKDFENSEVQAVTPAEGPIDDYKFRSTYIGKNRYGVLLRRDNPLARNGEISLKDLSQFPIAVKGKEYNIYDLHINKFIMKNIYPQVELECSDDSFLFEFVSRNHGGAVIMDFQVKQKTFIKYMEEYDLVLVRLNDEEFSRDVYFVENRDGLLTDAECRFKNYVLENIK